MNALIDAIETSLRERGRILDPLPDVEPPAPTTTEQEAAGLTLSVSEVNTLRRCPRRYYYEYVVGRRPARPSVEQEWGGAVHRGLEAWWRGAVGSERARDFAVEHALTAGRDHTGAPYTPPADPYARAALRAMLRAYAAVWGPVDGERYEVLAVELPFDLPVLTKRGRVSARSGAAVAGARREGRLDGVVRERPRPCERCGGPSTCFGTKDGDGVYLDLCDAHCGHEGTGCAPVPGPVWILEHKTTGKPPADERWYAGIELDLQTATYFDAATILGYAPAGVLYDVVRRPDFDDPKPAPALTKSGAPRKARTEACGACGGFGTLDVDIVAPKNPCEVCKGEGRVEHVPSYSNPRFGESASSYEQRLYELATSKPAEWFARRELPITAAQVQAAREAFHAAALEVRWRERTGLYPQVGDRYVCAPRGAVCPWLEVCGGRVSGEDDRLFPLRARGGGKE